MTASANRHLSAVCHVLISIYLLTAVSHLYADSPDITTPSYIASESSVDWTKKEFISEITLDMTKTSYKYPAGRTAASAEMTVRLPDLIKDFLLALAVDSTSQLGDMVLQEDITLEQLTGIINGGKKSAAYFSSDPYSLMMDHSLQLNTLGLVFVRHNVPYTPRRPIDRVPSKIYTGIIIDARGELPVHGEFITSPAYPCLFPAVRDETMDLLYEKNMMNSSGARANGIAAYAWSDNETLYRDRIGVDPLRISARKIFGVNKTDPVISRSDALKILSVPENIKLLEEGRIVILLDKDKLIYSVAALQNDLDYYVTYREVVDYYYANKLPDVSVRKDQKGIQISVQNIRFQPDSDEILPDEKDRLDTIAKSLKNAVKDSGFTITVEGHTANVGKPEGEMRLSIERAETIVDEFVKRGIDRSLFTYKGYGGTIPVADNTTDEGRSQNRRVEINVMPIQTYIRRAP